MVEYINREWIVKKDKIQYWHFTCKQSSIVYRIFSEDQGWTEDIKLLDDVLDGFAIDIDSKENIHLVCLNTKGELLYFMHNGTHWYNKVLATYSLDKYRLKHITVSCWDKSISILFAICLLKNPSVWSIRHNFWNGTKWENYKAVRITEKSNIDPFYVGYDHAGTMHLVYKAPRLGVQQLYYCRFRADYLVWSNPERISTVTGGVSYHYAMTDNKDNLHLVWNQLDKNAMNVKYLQRSRISYPRGIWKNDYVITEGDADTKQPLLYIIGNTQWVVWAYKNLLYGSFSYDDGKNWTSPVSIDIPLDCQFKIYNVVLNTNEYSGTMVAFAYGYERNGNIIIPVIDDVIGIEHLQQEKRNKSIDVNEEKIKEYAAEAKDSIGKLVEEVGKIEGKKKEIEEMILRQTEEINRTHGDLGDFRKEVQQLEEQLEKIKNENSGIISSINKWQSKYKEHQQVIEEMIGKHKELSERVKTLSERSIVKKILDYFK